MKIKLSANWCSSEEVTQRLLRQFSPTNHLNIQFVHDQSYDKIIFFNYINEEIEINKKAFILPQEPFWSGSHQKSIKNLDNITYYGFEKNIYDVPENVIECKAFTFYGGRGEWIDDPAIWNYNNIINNSNNIIKTKNISSAVTPLFANNGEFCLYPERFNIIKNLMDNNKPIDFYGGWEVYHDNDNIKKSPFKIDTVKDYRFTLVIENEYRRNWISEKFYDAILWDTIPIYYGCSNISEIYPNGGYIEIKNINEISNIIDTVAEMPDLYFSMIDKLKIIKNDYLIKNNLYHKIFEIANSI